MYGGEERFIQSFGVETLGTEEGCMDWIELAQDGDRLRALLMR
jgi:hypothetical protein